VRIKIGKVNISIEAQKSNCRSNRTTYKGEILLTHPHPLRRASIAPKTDISTLHSPVALFFPVELASFLTADNSIKPQVSEMQSWVLIVSAVTYFLYPVIIHFWSKS